jgi:uroporphyrinogen decarboxylase
VNSHERVRCAIDLHPPDRIPLTHATLPGAYVRYGERLDDLYRRYPADVIQVGSATSGEFGPEIGVPSRDTWGSLWVRATDEHKGQIVHCPLADWDAVPSFQPPDTSSDAILQEVEGRIATNAGTRYTLADGDTLWQRMFYLHGVETTLEDLALQPERCADLRDMILRVMVRRVERLCRLPGLDGIHFRDDWGTQRALMIRPALWRAFFKPAYARLFALVRDADKHVWFHSDGAITAILPDLIEIGVQVINPQVPLIGRERLAGLCRGRVCVEGDIDRQWALPYGTPQEVRAEVRADVAAFDGLSGGYIGRGEVAGDIPWDNIVALLDEIVNGASAP